MTHDINAEISSCTTPSSILYALTVDEDILKLLGTLSGLVERSVWCLSKLCPSAEETDVLHAVSARDEELDFPSHFLNEICPHSDKLMLPLPAHGAEIHSRK